MKILKLTIVILVLFALTIACSSDDSISEPKTESFRVKAVSITALQFPDIEGDALELYGRISTVMAVNGTTEERILWERNRDTYESVGTQEFLINSEGSEHVFTINKEELQNSAELRLYAQMYDRDPDGNNDDYLGNELSKILARDFTNFLDDANPAQIEFRLIEFNDVEVLVRLSVEHIRD